MAVKPTLNLDLATSVCDVGVLVNAINTTDPNLEDETTREIVVNRILYL